MHPLFTRPVRALAALLAPSTRTPAALATLAALSFAAQRPQDWAVADVRLEPSEEAPHKTLVLRDGRITQVLEAGAALPADLRVLDGHGLLALPSFIDAYSFAGCPPPQVRAEQDLPPKANADLYVDMREANRKGITPAYRAAEVLALDEEARKRWRASGFSHLVSSPHGELLAGASALVCTRTLAARDAVVRADLFQEASFECSGPGYPGTLMGAIAQLRQLFLDARWSDELARREREGKPGPRAPFDRELQAILPALRKEQRVVCAAESAADIERWIALADEFGFEIAIAGGREAWKRAELLAQRKIPVFLTLEWGEEPEDPHAKDAKPPAPPAQKPGESAAASEPKSEAKPAGATESKPATSPDTKAPAAADARYEVPLRVREDRRRRWEENRDGAQKLAAAGVEFALGTGKAGPNDLLERVRGMIEKGLARERARTALTSGAARLVGLGNAGNVLQPGAGANLALWTADPLQSKDAKLAWLFIEGCAHDFQLDASELAGKPDAGVDAGGDWTFRFERADAQPAEGHLDMQSDGTLAGTLRVLLPGGQAEQTVALAGRCSGRRLHLAGKLGSGNFPLELVLDATLEGETWKGTSLWKGSEHEDSVPFSASRKPKRAQRTGTEEAR